MLQNDTKHAQTAANISNFQYHSRHATQHKKNRTNIAITHILLQNL